MQKKENHLKKKILLGIIALLLTILVAITIFLVRATLPSRQAEKEAIKIAQDYAQVKTVDEFYWFNRNETYFTIAGKNTNNETIYVIIPKSGGNVTVLNQADGQNETQIRSIMATTYHDTDIKKISLGLYKGKPTWEIVTKNQNNLLNYYLLSFESAEEILVVENV